MVSELGGLFLLSFGQHMSGPLYTPFGHILWTTIDKVWWKLVGRFLRRVIEQFVDILVSLFSHLCGRIEVDFS
jgi:hypothetical protein